MKRIDFNKRRFIQAFERLSAERSHEDPSENWDRIIASHCDLSPEENLARLVWKGIDAQTGEYREEINALFGGTAEG